MVKENAVWRKQEFPALSLRNNCLLPSVVATSVFLSPVFAAPFATMWDENGLVKRKMERDNCWIGKNFVPLP